MPYVPKKNIDRAMRDVKDPASDAGTMRPEDAVRFVAPPRAPASPAVSRVRRWWWLWAALGACALVFGAFLFLRYSIAASTRSAFQKIAHIPFIGLREPLPSAPRSASADFGSFLTLLKNAGQSYGDLQSVAGHFSILMGTLETLQTQAVPFLFDGKGDALVSLLSSARDSLDALRGSLDRLQGQTSGLLPFSPADYTTYSLRIVQGKHFLDAFIPWMQSATPRHVLVLFENTAELRPGGGFLGSYADVTMAHGAIAGIDVHDINDADRLFTPSLIPPKPLQSLVTRWRAADSNWFFDFPSSAKKMISFLEASDLYKGKETFDGAIAITPRVIADILRATGPLRLADGTMLRADTVAGEIQKSVEDAQSSGAAHPKNILNEVVSEIIIRLKAGTSTQPIINSVPEWARSRDLRVFFKDAEFESFADVLGASGKAFSLPSDFSGTYLAVVNANVGGGKTDTVMKERVTLQSQINPDGTVSNELHVTRTNPATAANPWWERSANRDYLMAMTNPDARLSGFSGGARPAVVRRDRAGFSTDADLAAQESTIRTSFAYPAVDIFSDAGKNVFATRLDTPMGASSDVTMNYTHSLFLEPAPGRTYTFVLETQPGDHAAYHVEIGAPVGLRFADTHLPLYEYDAVAPVGRAVVTLTFESAND